MDLANFFVCLYFFFGGGKVFIVSLECNILRLHALSHIHKVSLFLFLFFQKMHWQGFKLFMKCIYSHMQKRSWLCSRFVCVCVCVYVYMFFTEVSPEAEGGPGIQKSHNKYLLNEQERSSWLFLVITFHCHIWMNFDVGYQKVVESFSLKYLYCPIIQYGSHQLHAISMLQDTYNITKSH